MLKLIKELIWPDGTYAKLKRLLGAFSLYKVLQIALGSGVVGALAFLFDYYEHVLSIIAGPIEPYITEALTALGKYYRLSLHLEPHWKHIFVLLGIYFFREVSIGARSYGIGYAFFNLSWGALVALIFSVLAGTIPSEQASQITIFLVGAFPVLGAAAYAMGGFLYDATFIREDWARKRNLPTPTWGRHIKWGFARVARRTVVGLVLLWIGAQIGPIRQLPQPGLALFALLIFVLACYWLVDGAREANRIRKPGDSWVEAYLSSDFTRLGLEMLGTIFWVFLLLVANAGH